MPVNRLLASAVSLFLATATAFGHGSMTDPVSRSYQGFLENPQNPQSNAVLAAVAVGGAAAFYDWHEVSRNIPDHNYPAVIPDGQLPGVGQIKYAGLNLARTDWIATSVVAGPRVCRFHAATVHEPSFFTAFITRDGYDPTQPLKWADLVEIPGGETATLADPCNNGSNGGGDPCQCGTDAPNYFMTLQFPQRVGRHVLYVAWQRIDPVGEVFFSTSDLDFGGVDYGESPAPPIVSIAATFALTSQWTGGGQGSFRVTNHTQHAIQGWTLKFDWTGQITSAWDCTITSQVGNQYTVGNASYNGAIAPGEFVDLGFVATFAPSDLQPANVSAFGGGSSPLPIVDCPGSANLAVGQAFSYQITSTGQPTSFSATGLSDGLSVNSKSGEISGVPTTAALCVASIYATNANGTGVKLLTLTVRPCQGDGNSDGFVDGIDLLSILNWWGQTSPYDFNNDGVTDASDLTIVLQGWGSCQ